MAIKDTLNKPKVININKKQGSDGVSNPEKVEQPKMLTDSNLILTREVPVGKLLKGKEFESFETLRRGANKIVNELRNDWLAFLLMKNGIYINYSEITKREIVEIYEKNGISIVNQDNVDRVFFYNKLLGEWNKERKLYFDDEGRILMEIKYSVL